MRSLVALVAAAAAACASGASNDAASAPGPAEPTAELGNTQIPSPREARKPPGEAERRDAASAAPADVPDADGGDRLSGPAGDGADQCGASRYHWLVGRPRSAIPATPSGANWRITCSSCPITMDHSPARLNIFFDAETESVVEVRCG